MPLGDCPVLIATETGTLEVPATVGGGGCGVGETYTAVLLFTHT
jgi:hypothetical protein